MHSVRKVNGQKRGMAGTKRKKYLAAKVLETRKEFVKSKLLRIVGPMVRVPLAYH